MPQKIHENHSVIAGIDAGGTTFKCCIATLDGEILARKRIETSIPATTLGECGDFFEDASRELSAKIACLGIASFGPIDVDGTSASYGTILDTPKANWSQVDLKSAFEKRLAIPVIVDTDVNGALLAEMGSGSANGCSSAAYMTVGTGIGAGIYANGGLVGKPTHPEFGHIYVPRHAEDTLSGCCSFHENCLEGLASARAFTLRAGDPKRLSPNDPAWRIEAFYLAQACWALSLSFRLERIILGGGLMQAPHLLPLVWDAYRDLAGSYLRQSPAAIETLITRPKHGDDAGLIGGIVLAQQLIDTP